MHHNQDMFIKSYDFVGLKQPQCRVNDQKFMLASDLGECLSVLGGPSGQKIEFIETHYGHMDYLDNICRSMDSKWIYDRIRTEQQRDKCKQDNSTFMYPANCTNRLEGCMCQCSFVDYIGFYCTGNNKL